MHAGFMGLSIFLVRSNLFSPKIKAVSLHYRDRPNGGITEQIVLIITGFIYKDNIINL